MLIAMTREVNDALDSGELTFLPRTGIDMDLALHQHHEYQSALSSLGCEIVVVPTHAGLPDSVFIEDTVIVLDEIAVLCRPGAESRRPEVPGVADILRQYRILAEIQSPGTLDGGDLLRVGKVIYAGLSTRSNQSGIEQLGHIVSDFGYSVKTLETTACLHLKSSVTQVAPGKLLINPDWVSRSAFGGLELIDIDQREEHAANALLVGQSIIYPSSFPRTAEKLLAGGLDVIPVDVSELQKAEGAVTCCSLIFNAS